MQKTLKGVKVLDMTMAISGPIATRILSDFGAEIVLVEPTGGSSIRTFGEHTMGLKCYGKKSVGCNLKTEEGKEIIKKLVEWAIVGIMYLIVITILSYLAKLVERRMNRGINR